MADLETEANREAEAIERAVEQERERALKVIQEVSDECADKNGSTHVAVAWLREAADRIERGE